MANGEFPSLGIHSDIAEDKKEYWSSFAPRALEAVLSIGQKARDGTLSGDQKLSLILLVLIFYFYEAVDMRRICSTYYASTSLSLLSKHGDETQIPHTS